MHRTMLDAKIHRATATDSDSNHDEDVVAIDPHLMSAAGLHQFEQVHVLNLSTGARFRSYAVGGSPREIGIRGPSARLVATGDLLILLSFVTLADEECATY